MTDAARWLTNLVLFGVLIMSALVGQSLIKIGLRSVGEFSFESVSSACSFFLGCSRSPYVWAGAVCVGSGFGLWMAVLSRMELSQAVPMAAFSYIPWILVGRFFFNEQIGPMRLLGVLLIIAGVVCVGYSGSQ